MDQFDMFRQLLNRVLIWAQHRYAPYYLAGVSFIESSFFPIPPDVMLIPMSLTQPNKAFQFATITTIASVLGGICGYFLGVFLFHFIHPWIVFFGYENYYQQTLQWFQQWGIWVILLAGFTPIPYKLFTIGAGTVHMALLPFILCSVAGRSSRFFLVALLVKWSGKKIEHYLERYINVLGWGFLMIALTVYVLWKKV